MKKYQIFTKQPQNVTLEVENVNYTPLKGVFESCISIGNGDIEKTLSSVQNSISTYLITGRGGNHIWISLACNNQRIAAIYFK